MSADDGGRFASSSANPRRGHARFHANDNDGMESLRRERHYEWNSHDDDAMMMIAVIMIAVMMMNAGIAAVVTALPRRR